MTRATSLRSVVIATAALVLAAPGLASAAQLTTDRQCYISTQPMTVSGTGWAAGSAWSVGGALDGSGTADGAGAFAFETRAPDAPSGTKPRTYSITGAQDGSQVARTSFRVVDFLVVPKDPSGKPTGTTSWGFSGFAPGKSIFIHVKRGRKTYTDRVGRGDNKCGTLKTRLRRLPAVPANKIGFGQYKVYVDNRRKFSKGGLQYRAKIDINRVPA